MLSRTCSGMEAWGADRTKAVHFANRRVATMGGASDGRGSRWASIAASQRVVKRVILEYVGASVQLTCQNYAVMRWEN